MWLCRVLEQLRSCNGCQAGQRLSLGVSDRRCSLPWDADTQCKGDTGGCTDAASTAQRLSKGL